jgi:hypothetical protein
MANRELRPELMPRPNHDAPAVLILRMMKSPVFMRLLRALKT